MPTPTQGFFKHPTRRRPSSELNALDKLHDRKVRGGSLARPLHTVVLARRAAHGTGYYEDDDPHNPQQIVRWGAVSAPHGQVSRAEATSHSMHIGAMSKRNAPRVRKLGGGSNPSYDKPRALIHEVDAHAQELAMLQSAWRQPSRAPHHSGRSTFARNAPFSFHSSR